MATIRWEPVGELHTIQNEMNRLFNTMFDPPAQATRADSTMRRWIPAMDLVETGEHYVLKADLPGLSETDVNIEVENDVLTLSGERKTEHDDQGQGYYRVERGFGTFSRSLTLPAGVDPDSVQAHFDRGVLEIRIPKPEKRKPRQVAISVGDSAGEPKTIESAETDTSNEARAREPLAGSR
jgi:HSP20 family protein